MIPGFAEKFESVSSVIVFPVEGEKGSEKDLKRFS
jgi:hypothetical protein